ncbi:MAG: hypothetical protein ABSB35_21220 [Bryobacteraceae bacterium]|jgi:hypothetical protein
MLNKVRNARAQVAALRVALVGPLPDPIVQCLNGLIEAAQNLGCVEHELRSAGGQAEDPELRAEVKALKDDLRLVKGLIERGAALFQGWASLLSSATEGYRPSGEAAPLAASGCISIQG